MTPKSMAALLSSTFLVAATLNASDGAAQDEDLEVVTLTRPANIELKEENDNIRSLVEEHGPDKIGAVVRNRSLPYLVGAGVGGGAYLGKGHPAAIVLGGAIGLGLSWNLGRQAENEAQRLVDKYKDKRTPQQKRRQNVGLTYQQVASCRDGATGNTRRWLARCKRDQLKELQLREATASRYAGESYLPPAGDSLELADYENVLKSPFSSDNGQSDGVDPSARAPDNSSANDWTLQCGPITENEQKQIAEQYPSISQSQMRQFNDGQLSQGNPVETAIRQVREKNGSCDDGQPEKCGPELEAERDQLVQGQVDEDERLWGDSKIGGLPMARSQLGYCSESLSESSRNTCIQFHQGQIDRRMKGFEQKAQSQLEKKHGCVF